MHSVIDMARAEDDRFLVFFEAKCQGVKVYDLTNVHLDFGVPVAFCRDPSNPHDANCVEVYLQPTGWLQQTHPCADLTAAKLGHVDRASARWLSALLVGSFRITG